MVSLVKPKRINFIGEVPVIDRIEGSDREGDVVGTAKMELTKSGYVIAHIDLSESSPDILLGGFSLGEFSMPKEPEPCPDV